MAVFYGQRVHPKETEERRKKKKDDQSDGPPPQRVDSGLFCFVRARGNVLIKDFLQKSAENLYHEQSELIINPITMDQTIQYEIKENGEDVPEDQSKKTVL